MASEFCLHCKLIETVEKWTRNNRRATNTDIQEMVGQFAAEMLSLYGSKPVTIVIDERTFSSKKPPEQLH